MVVSRWSVSGGGGRGIAGGVGGVRNCEPAGLAPQLGHLVEVFLVEKQWLHMEMEGANGVAQHG